MLDIQPAHIKYPYLMLLVIYQTLGQKHDEKFNYHNNLCFNDILLQACKISHVFWGHGQTRVHVRLVISTYKTWCTCFFLISTCNFLFVHIKWCGFSMYFYVIWEILFCSSCLWYASSSVNKQTPLWCQYHVYQIL